MMLNNAEGVEKFSHEEKAKIIWEAFKERMGTLKFSDMHFNLDDLIQPVLDLENLIVPFTQEEIDGIVKNFPSKKSPGPDGFNTDFMKKCWPIIASDFYELYQGFYDKDIYLQSINNSFVVLIPKIHNPSCVSDFKPISLLNSSIKLITKILANMLQTIITKLIHQNQYGFLRSRNVQDGLAWSFEYLHLCHKSKREMVIVKLDFEKTFDKVEHEVILRILRHKSFPNRWVQGILNSGTSAALLNGTPGKVFHCQRGV
jgi:hypothetical protein